jgi:hypothetical protein
MAINSARFKFFARQYASARLGNPPSIVTSTRSAPSRFFGRPGRRRAALTNSRRSAFVNGVLGTNSRSKYLDNSSSSGIVIFDAGLRESLIRFLRFGAIIVSVLYSAAAFSDSPSGGA